MNTSFQSGDNLSIAPVNGNSRYVILDALRGFALLGIIMANFPEFSLYTFLPAEATESMSTFIADWITRFFLYVFVDGKFYTIFSLLFGVGFSIIISNVSSRGGNGYKIFYRRMFFLFLIGLCHLLFLWSGDILMLYALVGMLLPLFRKMTDKKILVLAGCFLLLPIVIDTICEVCRLNPSAALVGLQWHYCGLYGITEENFAYWLHDSMEYKKVFQFLIQGAFERMQEFVDGNRYFKVLGLFMIGYCIGRNKYYAQLGNHRNILKNLCRWGIGLGLPLSVIYAIHAIYAHPFGNGLHSFLYFISVYTLSFGYMATLCLLYFKYSNKAVWKTLSYPGRMALTNYIGQSLAGILIFYGIGLGYGANIGLFLVEVLSIGIFVFEISLSAIWLRYFRFGPLEWVWRCLTYGRIFPFLKKE